MVAPRLGISVRIDPGLYLSGLSQGVARHLGDLRVALRSLEDGSFSTKASAPRPGALLQFTFAPTAQPDTAAVRLCNRCFVNIVAELITYLDRMIAFQRCRSRQMTIPSGVTTQGDLLQFIRQQLEEEYSAVARDRRLSNPKKLDSFPGIAGIARDSALSYFAVRRTIEHHGDHPEENIALWYGRLKLVAGSVELTTPGQAAPPGAGISLGMDHVSRMIPAKTPVSLTEAELEHIVFTIQHLIGPEVRRVALESKPDGVAGPADGS